MNKIIDELENQATTLGNCGYSDAEFDVAKFCRLVVEECAKVVRNADLSDVEGGDSAVLWAASEQIKKHFGMN